MRIRAAVLAAVVFALVPAGTADASAATAKRCTAKGAKTVVKNSYARVFRTPGRGDDETGRLYGCMLSNGKRLLLATASDDEYVSWESFGKVTLNRRHVAWEQTSYDDSCKAACPPGYNATKIAILVYDLRARKQHYFSGSVKGDNLVVSRSGTPAWLQQSSDFSQVHAGNEIIDTGAIDDLTLAGITLVWTNAGQPKSALLR